MKRPTRKLGLARETIRELRRLDLVAGGARPTFGPTCTVTDCVHTYIACPNTTDR